MDDAVPRTSLRGRIALVGCVLALLGLVLVTLLQASAGVGSSVGTGVGASVGTVVGAAVGAVGSRVGALTPPPHAQHIVAETKSAVSYANA